MSADGKITLQVADSIIDCPVRATSMTLPVAVIRRLDALADAARLERPSRNEFLAALISATDLDQDALERIVREYRRRTIGEVLPADEVATEDSVVVPMRKPGRPPRRAS
jgi:predicted transcriptional regulator